MRIGRKRCVFRRAPLIESGGIRRSCYTLYVFTPFEPPITPDTNISTCPNRTSKCALGTRAPLPGMPHETYKAHRHTSRGWFEVHPLPPLENILRSPLPVSPFTSMLVGLYTHLVTWLGSVFGAENSRLASGREIELHPRLARRTNLKQTNNGRGQLNLAGRGRSRVP